MTEWSKEDSPSPVLHQQLGPADLVKIHPCHHLLPGAPAQKTNQRAVQIPVRQWHLTEGQIKGKLSFQVLSHNCYVSGRRVKGIAHGGSSPQICHNEKASDAEKAVTVRPSLGLIMFAGMEDRSPSACEKTGATGKWGWGSLTLSMFQRRPTDIGSTAGPESAEPTRFDSVRLLGRGAAAPGTTRARALCPTGRCRRRAEATT